MSNDDLIMRTRQLIEAKRQELDVLTELLHNLTGDTAGEIEVVTKEGVQYWYPADTADEDTEPCPECACELSDDGSCVCGYRRPSEDHVIPLVDYLKQQQGHGTISDDEYRLMCVRKALNSGCRTPEEVATATSLTLHAVVDILVSIVDINDEPKQYWFTRDRALTQELTTPKFELFYGNSKSGYAGTYPKTSRGLADAWNHARQHGQDVVFMHTQEDLTTRLRNLLAYQCEECQSIMLMRPGAAVCLCTKGGADAA